MTRRVLVTGGTGFLGRALVRRFLASGAERVVVYSRSESRQAAFAQTLERSDAARFFIGDVRDRERLEQAMWGCDAVVHAAALKRVDDLVSNPMEVRKTNVDGSAKVLAAALAAGVRRVVMISSDKAVTPANVYGASKAMMEHEAIDFNAISMPRGMAVACVRYGNVIGSTGSVIPLWRAALAAGLPLRLTDPAATRFLLSRRHAVDVVVDALAAMEEAEFLERPLAGTIFVPRLPSARMGDVAAALPWPWPDARYPVEVVGMRPGGEKLHEQLISDEEISRTVDRGAVGYMIRPHLHSWTARDAWACSPAVPPGLSVRSDAGPHLTVEEIRPLLAVCEQDHEGDGA